MLLLCMVADFTWTMERRLRYVKGWETDFQARDSGHEVNATERTFQLLFNILFTAFFLLHRSLM